MDVTETISQERTRQGMSMQALSRASGVSASTIQRIEAGTLVPTVATASRLLTALGKRLAVVDRRPSDSLREHADEVMTRLSRLDISHVRVFGSVARGTDTLNSDIDLLCEFPKGFGVRAFSLQDELAELLGFPVDLVDDAGSSSAIWHARQEAVPL